MGTFMTKKAKKIKMKLIIKNERAVQHTSFYTVIIVTSKLTLNTPARMAPPQPSLLGNTVSIGSGQRRRHHSYSPAPLVPIPFTCGNETPPECPGTPALPPPSTTTMLPPPGDDPTLSCPDYFRYIHDDLRPWRGAGITREAVERARPSSIAARTAGSTGVSSSRA